MHRALNGLYVITRPVPGGPDALAEAVEQAIAGGAVLVQYRDKSGDAGRREKEAGAVLEVCRAGDVPLVVNDDVDLARRVGADGVHLGADDPPIAKAREALGEEAVIGVSCYNELDRARNAETAGANYVAFGSFFPSPTKPDAVRAGPELLREGRRTLSVPLCAIGGITPENGARLVRAGADLVAVLSGVFDGPDVREAARRYATLFDSRPMKQGADIE